MIPAFSSAAWAPIWPALATHLWQSTLFAVVAETVALLLRRNQARVRYWLWLTASLKFLVPFSLLIGVGTHLEWLNPSPLPAHEVSSVVEQIGQSFLAAERSFDAPVAAVPAQPSGTNLPMVLLPAAWFCGCVGLLCLWCVRWRRLRAAVRVAVPLREGPEVEAVLRLGRSMGMRDRVELISAAAPIEPGIFGIFRPQLLLPAGIAHHLAVEHLDAIVGHELCHVRRRDNLAAAVHMVVEAVFWFHPLVWWLGARLVEER